jgi:hypothetical protein
MLSEPDSSRICLVVLGMHRSGTSALTGTLGLLGAALPSDLLGSDPYNIKGHFEPRGIIEVDEQLLSALGTSWHDVGPLNLSNLDPGVMDRFRADLIHAMEISYNGAPLFVLKEPRICRLFPLTRVALEDFGAAVRAIICVRDPGEVAQSCVVKNGMDLSHGFGLWVRYMLEAELHSRGLQRIFVDFSTLLQDWRHVGHKIEQGLGVKLSGFPDAANSVDEFLDQSLRHQRATEQTNRPQRPTDHSGNSTEHSTAWICYQALQKLICNPDDGDALQQLDLIRSVWNPASLLFASEPLAACRTELLNVQTRLAVAENNVAVAEKNVRDLNKQSEALREKITRLKRQKARLEEKRRKLLASTSWRLTAPIRKFKSALQKALNVWS